MFALFVHDDAKDDLEDLWKSDFKAAAKITVLLQELADNQELLDSLTIDRYGDYKSKDFEVRKWLEYWNRGRDIWRLKLWDLETKGVQYRIIYAFIPRRKHYYILAIAPRSFDYDKQHPITQRIINAYDNL